ncbi:hypothetical protein ACYFX5_16815 [Bremerella sp. T1]|uniref:hypothetical protein n=1 Tax=Bremerella sp. TYQ1 TaxID=3119568 RepID=UPI001CCDEF8C|nr:hypothetical protein [Bremerella volcania]UBM34721.1 hypothetical protein LA756_18765 [Bremerella volcania]
MIQSHHLPTCDDVFDVLTRGRFPTGNHETDLPVERHLTVCHSCRELAEALRPATDMLATGQTDTADEDFSLPVFLSGDSTPSSRCISDQHERPTSDIIDAVRGPLIALALCLMIMLAVSGSWHDGANDSNRVAPTGNRLASDGDSNALNFGPWAAERPVCTLASLELAQQNNEADGKLLLHLSGQQFTKVHCCCQCHHADSDHEDHTDPVSLEGPQLLALVNRCQHCHTE